MNIIRSALLSSLFFSSSVFAQPVNINTASAEEIADALSGIGLSKAEAIVSYREAHGAFETVEQLTLVRGIGEKTLEKLHQDVLLDLPE